MVGIARATTPADRVFDVCNTLLLLVLAFVTLYPLYYVGIVSLSHGHAVIRGEVTWWPVGLNLESYRAVLEAPYVLGSFRNTVWYTFVGTAVNVSMSALCAYPLAMKFFYGRRFLTGFVVATMFFKSGLIPLYLMVRSLGMLDTIWALVLPTAVVTYYMIIMRTFFQNIPEELNDSAYLDGANDIQIFLRVVLPISTPILATMTLFYAVQHWNSFFPGADLPERPGTVSDPAHPARDGDRGRRRQHAGRVPGRRADRRHHGEVRDHHGLDGADPAALPVPAALLREGYDDRQPERLTPAVAGRTHSTGGSLMKRLTVLCAVGLLAAGGAFAAPAAEEAMAMEPTVLTVVLSDRGTAPINVDSAVIDAVEEKLNIRFDLTAIAGGDYNAKKRTLIATDDVPDILRVHRNDLNEFGDTGVFLALNDMIDTMVPNYKRILEGNERVQKTAIDGIYYAFATTKHFEFHRGIISVIRTDVVEDLGLEQPQSFDELYEVLSAIKAAYPESHTWTTRGGGRSLVRNVSYAFGTGGDMYYDPDLDGGRWAYGPIQARYRDLLEYLHNAYVDGILDPDFATLTTTQWREKQAAGKSFFFYDNPTYGKRANDAIVPVNPDAWWAPTEVLANATGNRRSLFYEEEVWSQMWAVGQQDRERGRGRALLQLRLHPGVRGDEGVRARGRALGARRRRLSSSRTRCAPSTPARPAPT